MTAVLGLSGAEVISYARLSGGREVVFLACQYPLLLVLGVGADDETAPGCPDDAYRPTASIQNV